MRPQCGVAQPAENNPMKKPRKPVDILLDLPENADPDRELEITLIAFDELEFDDEQYDDDPDARHFTDDELLG